MATYKSEFFDHYYRGRLRPLSHYSLGWLPRWLKVDRPHGAAGQRCAGHAAGAKLAAVLGGLTTERSMPRFAGGSEWRKEVAAAGVAMPGRNGRKHDGGTRLSAGGTAALGTESAGAVAAGDGVVLFVDTFTAASAPRWPAPPPACLQARGSGPNARPTPAAG